MPSRRVAVFSDVHSNRLAMEAFLGDLENLPKPVDGCWCLGDIVGRGPEPLPVASRLKALFDQQSPQDQACWLAGNHDLLVLGDIPRHKVFDSHLGGQADITVQMADHNARQLNVLPEGHNLLQWLRRPSHHMPYPGVYLAHGGYTHNGNAFSTENLYGHYITNTSQASQQLKDLQAHKEIKPRLVVNGHTHIPMLVRLYQNDRQTKEILLEYQGQTFTGLEAEPICVNPGSIGFPRQKGEKIPSYAILTMDFDSDWLLEAVLVETRYFRYDWHPYFIGGANGTQGLMLRHDYPIAYRNEVSEHGLPTH